MGTPAEGRLAFLERKYQIDRKPLKEKLKASMEAQEEHDLYKNDDASSAIELKGLEKKLTYTQKCVPKAIKILLDALTESAFDDDIQKRLGDRLAYLGFYLDRFLAQRLEDTQQSLLFQKGRREGRPSEEQLNRCLDGIVRTVREQHPAMKEVDPINWTADQRR